MSDTQKSDLFDGILLVEGEEISEETVLELSNGRGDDDE